MKDDELATTQTHAPCAQPSIKQMRNRMLPQHREALRNVEAGQPMNCSWTISNTLMQWGAITGGHDNQLTDIGKALLCSGSKQS